MKANELRLRNFVGTYNKGMEDKIFTVAVENIRTEYKANKQGFTRYRGIPLTDEWHNKFGVIKNGFGDFVYEISKRQLIVFSGDYIFLRDLDGSEKPSYKDNICTLWNKDLKKRDINIHEFQNLHYALSGKELTIK